MRKLEGIRSNTTLGGIKLEPTEDDLLHWSMQVPGPVGSPYEGGTFTVKVNIPEQYPFVPPIAEFVTPHSALNNVLSLKLMQRHRIYHMNIVEGTICLDLLKENWSPLLTLDKLALSLSSLLTDPNPDDPLSSSIAFKYKHSRAEHDELARTWTQQYAYPTSSMTWMDVSTAAALPARPRPRPRPVRRSPGALNEAGSSMASGIAIEEDDYDMFIIKRGRAGKPSSEDNVIVIDD